MSAFSIDVHDQAVRAALDGLAKSLANLQPVLADVGEEIVQRAKARFGTGTGPDGVRWKDKKVKDGRPTLVGPSGDLRRQIVHGATRDTLTVQATPAYAAIQQFGGSIQRKASTKTILHRTNAKGELLRRAIAAGPGANFGGKALVFAGQRHKRVLERLVDVGAHSITIPARPFMPVRPDGTLYDEEQRLILAEIEAWLDAQTP